MCAVCSNTSIRSESTGEYPNCGGVAAVHYGGVVTPRRASLSVSSTTQLNSTQQASTNACETPQCPHL